MKTKHLITSALPYINGIKHIGNLVGSMLPADVYARYLRMIGEDVLFICATDEHGTPAEIGAREANMSVKEYCDKQHIIQKEIYEKCLLSFDHFGRTSSKQNIELTQEFAIELEKRGYIEKREIVQIYSIDDEMFLPDRYIEGTCPHCGSDRARGDQCDGCGALLDPIDLINPRSSISKSTNLEKRKTSHLFLLQSKLINEVDSWINEHENSWQFEVYQLAKGLVNQGIKDRCITRDLKWGVPVVGHEDLKEKVYYVWFDAPIGYIGATKEWSDLSPANRNWKDWWQNENVNYVQFMAKDNIPFHTIVFPSVQIGSGNKYKKVDYIKGMQWLNYYGDKFSTSRKYGIFLDEALKKYPADYWRYYLMKNIPEKSDFSFTWENFSETINSDLANVLGNYINRVLSMIDKYCDNNVENKLQDREIEKKYKQQTEEAIAEYFQLLSELNFGSATRKPRHIWSIGNEYIAESTPWKEENKEYTEKILYTGLEFIAIYSIISDIIIPETSEKIRSSIGLKSNIIPQNWFNILESKISIQQIGILFEKIEVV